MNTDTEIIRVTVTRSEQTDLYLRVPKGWRPDRNSNIIRLAALDVDDCEWDKDGWENAIEIHGWKRNAEKEAEGYTVFDATGGMA